MDREPLFPECERTGPGRRRFAEGLYDFYDMSAMKDAGRVRSLFNRWYEAYPDEHKREMRRRFECGDEPSFQSVVFELFIHAVLTALACDVAVHPVLARSLSRPDFLARHNDQRAFIEARVARGSSDEAVKAEANEKRFLTELKALPYPGQLRVMIVKQSRQPYQKLLEQIGEWLTGLSEMKDCLPEEGRHFDIGGWSILTRAKPYVSEGPRLFVSHPARWTGEITLLENALRKKGKKYGSLDASLVVAVNCLDHFVGQIDVFERLKSFWHDGKRPRTQVISGVLVAQIRTPNDWTRAPCHLYLNPWATHPYSGPLTTLRTSRVDATGEIATTEGVHAADILGMNV